MNIKIHTNLSEQNDEIEITIKAPQNASEVKQIVETIQSISNQMIPL